MRALALGMKVAALAGLGLLVTQGCGGEDGGVADNTVGSGGSAASGGTGTGGSAASGAAGAGGSGGSAASGGTGAVLNTDGGGGVPPGQDTDDDGIPDVDELPGDSDGDGIPNVQDPINDGDPPAIKFTQITTPFNSPIGIDYHEPTNSVVMSVNYSTGSPAGFERVEQDGQHQQFSTLSGLTDEVKIATARSKNPGGFTTGDLFVGNGVDGQIVRITDGGNTVINPWVDLPGDNNGLMRGSLYVDRTGIFGGDLCVVTTNGEAWRVTAGGTPSKIAAIPGVHLEGAVVVPNKPARYGPIAGKLIAGAEAQGLMYVFDVDGTYTTMDLKVAIEDIDIISPKENFFGVNYGTSFLIGAEAKQWEPMVGDILLAQESVTAGTSGLFRLKWDGTQLVAQAIPIATGSATLGQWEHVTFAAAGIKEVPPVPR